jgi:hypothetical protein
VCGAVDKFYIRNPLLKCFARVFFFRFAAHDGQAVATTEASNFRKRDSCSLVQSCRFFFWCTLSRLSSDVRLRFLMFYQSSCTVDYLLTLVFCVHERFLRSLSFSYTVIWVFPPLRLLFSFSAMSENFVSVSRRGRVLNFWFSCGLFPTLNWTSLLIAASLKRWCSSSCSILESWKTIRNT